MKCRIVSNSSARSPRVIVCEQSRTSMIMSAWCLGCVCGLRMERNVRQMRAVKGCECIVFPTIPGQSQVQFLFRVARTRQQACVARVQFVTLHDFSNVLFCPLVCSLFATCLSPCIMHGACWAFVRWSTNMFVGRCFHAQ